MNTTTLARTLTLSAGVDIDAEQVIASTASGYAIVGFDREDAHRVAAAIITAFGADPESGWAEVRIVPAGQWRGFAGVAVRVTIDR